MIRKTSRVHQHTIGAIVSGPAFDSVPSKPITYTLTFNVISNPRPSQEAVDSRFNQHSRLKFTESTARAKMDKPRRAS
jgi:hypothetical protein